MNDKTLTPASQALMAAIPEAAREGRLLPAPTVNLADQAEDFELPSKACDIGRPEGCESCQ